MRSNLGRTPRLFVLALAIVSWSASAQTRQEAPAAGTGGADIGIPCAVAAKPALDSADKDRIRAFASAQIRSLRDPSVQVSMKARDALAAPLDCPNTTIAFRLEYTEALLPELRALLREGDDRLAVNALLLLGRVRTTTAAEALLESLASQRPVIRVGAASGLRETLSQIARDSLGFSDAAVNRLLDAAAEALARESDTVVADMLVVTLGDAARSNQAIRVRSNSRLAEAFGRRLRTLREGGQASPEWSPVVVRAVDLVRQTFFDQVGAGAPDREFARRSALLAGQVFAYARALVEKQPAAADSDLSRAVGAAEGLAIFVHGAVAGDRLPEQGLPKIFDQARAGAGPVAFAAAVDSWIGPTGRLTRPPYNAAAGEFQTR